MALFGYWPSLAGTAKILFTFLICFSLFLTPQIIFGEKIIIVHTSDIHGHLNPIPDPTSNAENKPLVGGFAALSTFLTQTKLEALKNGALAITLDSGDLFQGTPVVEQTKGACMIDMLNRLHYLAGCLGNHDFDYGVPTLRKRATEAKYPWVVCNLFDSATGRILPFVKPYLIVPFKGIKIGITGILTPDTVNISFEKNIQGITFKDPVPIVNRLAVEMRRKGADFIILLAHMGIEDDRRIVKQLKQVDLILGGHSHTTMDKIEFSGPGTPALVHPGADGRTASKVEVEITKGGKPEYRYTPISLYLSSYPEDPSIKAVTDTYQKEIDKLMNEIIGSSDVELVRGVVGGDSPEGSFMTDAMREATQADFAFINLGGIRYPIARGKITLGDIFCLMPFDNTLDVLNLTGQQVIDMIEQSLSVPFSQVNQEDIDYAITNFRMKPEGLKREFMGRYGYLVPSNLKVTFDPTLPALKRLVKITDGTGKYLDLKQVYKVAINSYMSNGGDGYKYLKDHKDRTNSTILIRDSITQKVRRDRGIKVTPEQRMFNQKLKVTLVNP